MLQFGSYNIPNNLYWWWREACWSIEYVINKAQGDALIALTDKDIELDVKKLDYKL